MQLNLDKTESGHLIDFPACLLLTGRQEICGRWEPAPNDMTASAAEGKTAWRPKEVQIYVYKWIVLLTISNPERWVKVNMLVYGTQVFKHLPACNSSRMQVQIRASERMPLNFRIWAMHNVLGDGMFGMRACLYL